MAEHEYGREYAEQNAYSDRSAAIRVGRQRPQRYATAEPAVQSERREYEQESDQRELQHGEPGRGKRPVRGRSGKERGAQLDQRGGRSDHGSALVELASRGDAGPVGVAAL